MRFFSTPRPAPWWRATSWRRRAISAASSARRPAPTTSRRASPDRSPKSSRARADRATAALRRLGVVEHADPVLAADLGDVARRGDAPDRRDQLGIAGGVLGHAAAPADHVEADRDVVR